MYTFQNKKVFTFYSPHSIGVWCPKILASLTLSALLPLPIPASLRYSPHFSPPIPATLLKKAKGMGGIWEAEHTLENGPANYGSVFLHPPVLTHASSIHITFTSNEECVYIFLSRKIFINNIYLKMFQLRDC